MTCHMYMFGLTALIPLVATVSVVEAAGFSAAEKLLHVSYDFSGHAAAKWQNGYLLHVNADSGTIVVHDGTGNLKTAEIAVPDSRTTIYDITASPSGKFAASGTAFGARGQVAAFIAWLDSKGSVEHLVRTSPFGAMAICFANDGALWAVGREHDGQYKEVPGHSVLRRYSSDGKLLSTALPVDTFGRRNADKDPHPASLSHLVATASGLALYSGSANEYIELSASGTITGRWGGVPKPPGRLMITGIGVTLSGLTYISTQQRDEPDGKDYMTVFRLDKGTGQWTQIPIADDTLMVNTKLVVHGTDGERLVIKDMSTGVLSWVRDTTAR